MNRALNSILSDIAFLLRNKSNSIFPLWTFINKKALNFFDINSLSKLSDLDKRHPGLARKLNLLSPSGTSVIEFPFRDALEKFHFSATELFVMGKYLKVVVFTNIQKELESIETESYVRLIRILIHEINNSLKHYGIQSSNCLTYIGRMVERKAPQMALYYWEELLKYLPASQLIMIGDGPLLELLSKQADESVTFTGSIYDEKKIAFGGDCGQ